MPEVRCIANAISNGLRKVLLDKGPGFSDDTNTHEIPRIYDTTVTNFMRFESSETCIDPFHLSRLLQVVSQVAVGLQSGAHR